MTSILHAIIINVDIITITIIIFMTLSLLSHRCFIPFNTQYLSSLFSLLFLLSLCHCYYGFIIVFFYYIVITIFYIIFYYNHPYHSYHYMSIKFIIRIRIIIIIVILLVIIITIVTTLLYPF